MNEGLKEIGKGMITLANLILVLFLFNTYMQQDEFSNLIVFSILYGVASIYYAGYFMINKGNENGKF